MPLLAATPPSEANHDGPDVSSGPHDAALATDGSTATAELAPGCPQCGNLESWGRSSWCPECGFYPRLGTSVGRASDVAPPVEATPAPKSPREIWQHMPAWMKVLCVGMLAIVFESGLVRAATADDSLVRSVWGVLQFLMGFGVFSMFHAIATLKASMVNNRIGFFDALMHPFEVWRPTVDELPRTARRIWLAVWGLTAALCAMGIVGGIRYSVVVDDWGFKKRVDSALTTHVRNSRLKKPAGIGTLAVDPQTGAQERAQSEATLAAENAKRGVDVEVLALDCVVVGYNINPRDGSVSNLKLASLVDGDLQYVGTVSKGIPEDVSKELAGRLLELKRQIPVVKCRGSGIWVNPVVACKATFNSWTDDKMMVDPEFQELMAEIDYVE